MLNMMPLLSPKPLGVAGAESPAIVIERLEVVVKGGCWSDGYQAVAETRSVLQM